MRDIDVAPLPLSHLESHLDEVAIKRLHTSLTGAEDPRRRSPPLWATPWAPAFTCAG